MSGDQSWSVWMLIRLVVVLPIGLGWALLKKDWKEQDAKKKEKQPNQSDSD